MSNSMFYTGLSGLNAAQAALVTTGHNTANVNTPGYNRQTAQIASAGGANNPGVGFFGNGAKVVDVSRSYDQFLTSQLNQAQSASQSLTTYSTQISQIDNLLANQTAGLAPQLQTLFSHVQAVANNPADPSARQQLISSSQALANQFRSMDQYLTGLNANVNDQVSGNVDQINTYTQQIASLNKQVALISTTSGGQAPNDLLDQRDQLISDLGQLVGTKVMVQDGGQFNVYMGNGQALVLGDQATRLAAVRSAGDPGRIAVATVNAAGKTVEMQDSMLSGGSLGGLLQFRSETLAPAQNTLGRMALSLADTFNAQQKLGMDLNGAMGTDFFSQATPGVIPNGKNTGGGTLVPRFSDISQLTTSDYRVNVTGASSFTVTRLSDNTVVKPDSTTGAYDGVTLTLGGTAVAGDSFLLQPTRTGARDLTVRISDPAKVAAASPIITGNKAGNQGSGAITAGTVEAPYGSPAELASTGVTLTYDSATNELSGLPGGPVIYKPGEPIRFNGITVTISGTPANNDTFTIAKNTGGVSDGGNALLLGALQNKKTLDDGTASVSDAYRQLVSTVGNKARQVQIANTAQASVTTQIRSAQQSVSGVNQDEETANLLMFQQMYQANAKVIQTASTLFDTVLGISR
ncbi:MULTISPECIES: flagellar hook-associated protein FlgK [unclassified Polaromonas]|uniref:flagellar hook-associated protein FlgK n=1 Tax=unclassified Polaromonas TaxID=2638319 RepID=UPI0018C9834F|nr:MULTISPECIES: flagellar hook-associated protein FlgK [unclassified Polaromonas]MBG6070477.1 flagellar hook-associated protein 1 FlgK [Polaromonas sp. CG_9.7]MBG6112475.1 flagellar hook-associated protein 1 FlgK [Polaromonas sp. CG_9.2]